MPASHAVLGFENSDGSFRFGLTNKPINYLDSYVEESARFRWAVPARTYDEAVRLRNDWKAASASVAREEASKASVPESVIHELHEIWWGASGQLAEEEALQLIGEHGTYVTGIDQLESPHSCPFIPLPKSSKRSSTFNRVGLNLGIKLAIFDLDGTLVNSAMLEAARSARDWKQVHRRIEEVKPLSCWGGCAPHQLPGLLSELDIKIGLISRAPQWYVDAVVQLLGIHSDRVWAPCGNDKTGPFGQAMEHFGVKPAQTVVFGDDGSDFQAAAHHQVLSMGNPWAYKSNAAVAPDVAWLDSATLLEGGSWRERLPYIGEAEQDTVKWHRGSLLGFDDEAYALGRYFSTTHKRRHERLSHCIYDGKYGDSKLSENPHVLSAFNIAVQHLAKRFEVDVVLSVPPHQWQSTDRFEPYRKIVIDATSARDDVDIRELRPMPSDYKKRSYAKRRELRRGSFEIPDALDGRTVLLIDDVVSSGATLGALKHAAVQARAGRVIQLGFGFNQERYG